MREIYSVENEIGKTYNNWKITGSAGKDRHGATRVSCECLCGKRGRILLSNLKNGASKSCGCLRGVSGERHYGWKGGKTTNAQGYILISQPNHLHCFGKDCYVFEHRLIMEKHLGRYLTKNETVHHKNGVRDDNRIENLELWTKAHPRGVRVSDIEPEIVEIKILRRR